MYSQRKYVNPPWREFIRQVIANNCGVINWNTILLESGILPVVNYLTLQQHCFLINVNELAMIMNDYTKRCYSSVAKKSDSFNQMIFEEKLTLF